MRHYSKRSRLVKPVNLEPQSSALPLCDPHFQVEQDSNLHCCLLLYPTELSKINWRGNRTPDTQVEHNHIRVLQHTQQ